MGTRETERFPSVRRSTVAFIRRGVSLIRVSGELEFDGGYRLSIRERLTADRLPMEIDWYGYEAWHGSEKLFWYDSQPHPNGPTLQSTHPHHKHIPLDPKHNRIPAPGLSFSQPNLPLLIAELGDLVAKG